LKDFIFQGPGWNASFLGTTILEENLPEGFHPTDCRSLSLIMDIKVYTLQKVFIT